MIRYWFVRGFTFVALHLVLLWFRAYERLYSTLSPWLYKRGLWRDWMECWPGDLRDRDKYARLLEWLCGWNGHSSVVWYNPGGFEPDMTCTRCGQDLG